MALCRIPVPGFALLLAALSGPAAVLGSLAAPNKYLIVSSPSKAEVLYMRLNPGGVRGASELKTLIGAGVAHPFGVAIVVPQNKLLVADPDSQTIFSYAIIVNSDLSLRVSDPIVAVSGIESRWVAADDRGNVFFTDEAANKIYTIDAKDFAEGNTTHRPVVDGSYTSLVSAPGGVAVDSFRVFWANKQTGTKVGSLVQATPAQPDSNVALGAQALTQNVDKSYGVCLAMHNVFYTQPEQTIYGVDVGGGDPVAVTNRLVNPRGCSFDGDGTIYVADRGIGAVYSFAGNMQKLGTADLEKVAVLEDAFGVAVYSGAKARLLMFPGLVALLASVLSGLATLGF